MRRVRNTVLRLRQRGGSVLGIPGRPEVFGRNITITAVRIVRAGGISLVRREDPLPGHQRSQITEPLRDRMCRRSRAIEHSLRRRKLSIPTRHHSLATGRLLRNTLHSRGVRRPPAPMVEGAVAVVEERVTAAEAVRTVAKAGAHFQYRVKSLNAITASISGL